MERVLSRHARLRGALTRDWRLKAKLPPLALVAFSQSQLLAVLAGWYGPLDGGVLLLAAFYAVIGVASLDQILSG